MTWPPQGGGETPEANQPPQQPPPQQPPPQQPYEQQPYQPPPEYGQPSGYGYAPQYPAGYGGYPPPPVVRPTNTMAVLSLVFSLIGIVTWGLAAVAGIILGHLARRQIRTTGEGGSGLATAGLIIGYIVVILAVAGCVGVIVAIAVSDNSTTTY